MAAGPSINAEIDRALARTPGPWVGSFTSARQASKSGYSSIPTVLLVSRDKPWASRQTLGRRRFTTHCLPKTVSHVRSLNPCQKPHVFRGEK
jgi:hypothetical protein